VLVHVRPNGHPPRQYAASRSLQVRLDKTTRVYVVAQRCPRSSNRRDEVGYSYNSWEAKISGVKHVITKVAEYVGEEND